MITSLNKEKVSCYAILMGVKHFSQTFQPQGTHLYFTSRIDLIMVFNAIVTGRHNGQKLQVIFLIFNTEMSVNLAG